MSGLLDTLPCLTAWALHLLVVLAMLRLLVFALRRMCAAYLARVARPHRIVDSRAGAGMGYLVNAHLAREHRP